MPKKSHYGNYAKGSKPKKAKKVTNILDKKPAKIVNFDGSKRTETLSFIQELIDAYGKK